MNRRKLYAMNYKKQVSSCCGVEASGEAVDMGICAECKDQCVYDYMDDDEEENSMLMGAFSKSEEIDEDFDDPVWDATDYLPFQPDLP